MSMFIPDSQLETFLLEDAPYGDLTCQMLGLKHQPGLLSFIVRHDATVCGGEEAARLAEMSGARLIQFIPAGEHVRAGTCLLEVRGEVSVLHQVWRTAGNLLEYMTGIATRTSNMCAAAQAVNPQVTVAATRKIFPGTKRLVTRAVMAGGGQLHRLGLSETVLVFKNHLNFFSAQPDFEAALTQWRSFTQEKKITIEVENTHQALELARAGVDAVQLDKMGVDELTTLVKSVRAVNPEVKLIAAGGLNQGNIADYAATGVDILVLSSVYFGPPADIGARIEPAPVDADCTCS